MVRKLIESNFAPIIILGIVLGLVLPELAALHFLNSYLLASVIFLSSLSVDFTSFFNYLKDYRFFGSRLLLVKILLPLVVFYILAFISPNLALGGLLIVAMPSAVSNVVMSNLFRANSELTLSFTIASHLLSIAYLPLLLFIVSGQSVSFDYASLSVTLIQVALIPLILSYIVKNYFWKNISSYSGYFSSLSILFIFAIVAIITSVNRESFFEFYTLLGTIVFAFVLSVLLIAFGLMLARNRRDKLALSLSTFRINASLALYLANEFFPKEVILVLVSLQLIFDGVTAAFQWFAEKYIT